MLEKHLEKNEYSSLSWRPKNVLALEAQSVQLGTLPGLVDVILDPGGRDQGPLLG